MAQVARGKSPWVSSGGQAEVELVCVCREEASSSDPAWGWW